MNKYKNAKEALESGDLKAVLSGVNSSCYSCQQSSAKQTEFSKTAELCEAKAENISQEQQSSLNQTKLVQANLHSFIKLYNMSQASKIRIKEAFKTLLNTALHK